MYRGEIPEFDSEAGIEANASVLYGILGLMPATLLNMYRTFKTDSSWGAGTPVSKYNQDFVLLLHLLRSLKGRPDMNESVEKEIIAAYCGEPGSKSLQEHKRRLLSAGKVRFILMDADCDKYYH